MTTISLRLTTAPSPRPLALTGAVSVAKICRRSTMCAARAVDVPTEAELVERYRATGDQRWFAELYRLTRRRVFAVCLRRVGDAGRAEDLCHDAFLRAFDRFDDFGGSTFASWVCRIAINLALNELRHRAVRERAAGEIAPPAAASEAERRAVARQELARAVELLDRLEARQRRVFLLRHVDELSHAEIARRTGYTGEQVRSYLQNARRNFRLAWAARESEEVADG